MAPRSLSATLSALFAQRDRQQDRRSRSVLTRIVCVSAACASAFAGTAAMAQRDRSAMSQLDHSALVPC